MPNPVSTPNMTEPPLKNGFRLRGLQTTRIETLTDAAFAFALTLLVVSLDPPNTFDALSAALRNIPAFLVSATLLMVFWWGHHEWSRRYGLDDGPSVVLSCLLVFTVLVYVYPLRFMFGLMMRWLGGMTGLPLGSREMSVGAEADVSRLFVLYGAGFVAMCLALVLLYLHAWRRRDELELSAVERHDTLSEIGAWMILLVTGVLSILLAFLFPRSRIGLPGWAYMLLPVAMPAYAAVSGRRRARLAASDPLPSGPAAGALGPSHTS